MAVATSSDWSDVEKALGSAARRPNTCWCQRFLRHQAADDRSALRQELSEAAVPIGPIAYLDNAPVGWTRVMPSTVLPGVMENRALQRLIHADDGGWWITCVNVLPVARGHGVGVALLHGTESPRVEWRLG